VRILILWIGLPVTLPVNADLMKCAPSWLGMLNHGIKVRL
jgi:hypothetical protein